jgi:hypothetical protein
MCLHCAGFWPIKNIACKLLGLDTTNPYWMKGTEIFMIQTFVTNCMLGCDYDNSPFGYIPDELVTRDWLIAHTPNYNDIIHEALDPIIPVPVSNLDMYDYCEMDLNHNFLMQNYGIFNPGCKNPPPGLTQVNLQLWGDAVVLIGKLPLCKDDAALPEHYDDKFFFNPHISPIKPSDR